MRQQNDYCWGEMYGSLSSILTRLKKLKKFKSFYWDVEELDEDVAKDDGKIIKRYLSNGSSGFKQQKALITNYRPGESFFRVRIYGPKIKTPITKTNIEPALAAPELKDHRVILTRLTRNFSHSSDTLIVSDPLTHEEAVIFADEHVRDDVVADIVKVITRVEMSVSDILKADIRKEIMAINKDPNRDLTLLNTLMMRWDTIPN